MPAPTDTALGKGYPADMPPRGGLVPQGSGQARAEDNRCTCTCRCGTRPLVAEIVVNVSPGQDAPEQIAETLAYHLRTRARTTRR